MNVSVTKIRKTWRFKDVGYGLDKMTELHEQMVQLGVPYAVELVTNCVPYYTYRIWVPAKHYFNLIGVLNTVK